MRKWKLTELGRVSPDQYAQQDKIPVVVVLDNFRSAMNVGSIFRTSDALAIEKIILCGITAQPPHREILKTAIGASATVEWEYYEDILVAADQLKEGGYQLIGIEQTSASIQLQDYDVNRQEQYAICLGNEVEGLSDALLPHLDAAIEIPQYGTKHSFNVAVCGGIVLWHFASAYHLAQ